MVYVRRAASVGLTVQTDPAGVVHSCRATDADPFDFVVLASGSLGTDLNNSLYETRLYPKLAHVDQ